MYAAHAAEAKSIVIIDNIAFDFVSLRSSLRNINIALSLYMTNIEVMNIAKNSNKNCTITKIIDF